MIEISAIDRFFESHPLQEYYFRFAENERKGACTVAERDARAAVGFMEIPENMSEIFLSAVAEQSIFLLLNPANLTGAADHVAAENSAGSSRSFHSRKNPLCLRAAALLAPLTGRGVISVNRG